MNNKAVMVIAVISLIASLSGWVMFAKEKARQEGSKEQLAEYVLQQVEDRRKMEESIKEQFRQKKQEKEVVLKLEYERQLQDSINSQLEQYEKDRGESMTRQFDDLRSWTGGLVKQQMYVLSGSLRKSVMEKLREYEQMAEEDATELNVVLDKRIAAYKDEIKSSLRAAIDSIREDIQQEFSSQRAEIRATLLKQKQEVDTVLRGAGGQTLINNSQE